MIRWDAQGDDSILTQGRRIIQDFSRAWRRVGATRRGCKVRRAREPPTSKHQAPEKPLTSKRQAPEKRQPPSFTHQGNFNIQAPSARGTPTAKAQAEAGILRVQLSVQRASLGFRDDWMPSETIAWKRRNQPRQTRRPRAGWKRGATSVELAGGSGCRAFFAREAVRVWRWASIFEWVDLGWAFMQI